MQVEEIQRKARLIKVFHDYEKGFISEQQALFQYNLIAERPYYFTLAIKSENDYKIIIATKEKFFTGKVSLQKFKSIFIEDLNPLEDPDMSFQKIKLYDDSIGCLFSYQLKLILGTYDLPYENCRHVASTSKGNPIINVPLDGVMTTWKFKTKTAYKLGFCKSLGEIFSILRPKCLKEKK